MPQGEHLDELKLEELLHVVISHDPENCRDDVHGAVPQIAQGLRVPNSESAHARQPVDFAVSK